MPPPRTYIFCSKVPSNAGNAVSETQLSKWDFKPIYFVQKCPQNAGNAVSETQISKWDFKPIYFAQKCPQNAGNAVSEIQISKNFRGGMTPLQLCHHYGLPLTKILATPLLIL